MEYEWRGAETERTKIWKSVWQKKMMSGDHRNRRWCTWVSSNVITRILAYIVFALWSTKIGNLVQGVSPNFAWNRGGVAVFSRKPALSTKRGKTGSRLLLTTMAGSCMYAFDWYQYQRPWMTLNGLMHSVSKYTRLSEPPRNLNYCGIARSPCDRTAVLLRSCFTTR